MLDKVYFVDRSERSRLEIGGPDRARFLHNLTTNDVKHLKPGSGQETFVTSPQGKTLGYMNVLATDDRLIARTDPNGFSSAMPHFQKYGVFDDVHLDELTSRTFEYHWIGPDVAEWLTTQGVALPPWKAWNHAAPTFQAIPIRVVAESPLGLPGWTVIGPVALAEQVRDAFFSDVPSIATLTSEQADDLRIAAGIPCFGVDVRPENLPQEVGRDSQAISFVKGCYLGQETVARIDALGHVNKLLKGFALFDEMERPRAESLLEIDGKKVGTLTSVSNRAVSGERPAIGYIKATLATAGTVVKVVRELGSQTLATAVVRDFPVAAADGLLRQF